MKSIFEYIIALLGTILVLTIFKAFGGEGEILTHWYLFFITVTILHISIKVENMEKKIEEKLGEDKEDAPKSKPGDNPRENANKD